MSITRKIVLVHVVIVGSAAFLWAIYWADRNIGPWVPWVVIAVLLEALIFGVAMWREPSGPGTLIR